MNPIPGGPFSPKGGGYIQSQKNKNHENEIFEAPNVNDFLKGEGLESEISMKELLSDHNKAEIEGLAQKLGKPASFFPIIALTMNPSAYVKVIYATFRQMKGKGEV